MPAVACDDEFISVDAPDLATTQAHQLLAYTLVDDILKYLDSREYTADAVKVKEYVTQIFNVFGPQMQLDHPLETMRDWGVLPIEPEEGSIIECRDAVRKLKTQNPRNTQVAHRDVAQYTPLSDLLQKVCETGLLTTRHLDVLSAYLCGDVDGEEGAFDDSQIKCVSNLVLNRKAGGKDQIQKLHTDHRQGPGVEVIVAFDLSGNALKTRCYAGTSRLGTEFAEAVMKPGHMTRRPLQGIASALTANANNAESMCSATRAIQTVIEGLNRGGVAIRYVEVDTPMMMFDAGGLHSGNTTNSDGPRIFLTFRNPLASYTTQDDTWATGGQFPVSITKLRQWAKKFEAPEEYSMHKSERGSSTAPLATIRKTRGAGAKSKRGTPLRRTFTGHKKTAASPHNL